jgi:hypothetical protein
VLEAMPLDLQHGAVPVHLLATRELKPVPLKALEVPPKGSLVPLSMS